MSANLLLAAIVIIACIILNKLSRRLGIPMLLSFILLGMFFGSNGFIKMPFENYAFAQQICSVALIFIMFYGGFGTSWKEAKPIAPFAPSVLGGNGYLSVFIVGIILGNASLKRKPPLYILLTELQV